MTVKQLRADEFVRPIRITELHKRLPVDQAIAALAIAMEELALAQMLAGIHGKERGAQIYIDRGGHVRFDSDGEPVILWSSKLMRSKS